MTKPSNCFRPNPYLASKDLKEAFGIFFFSNDKGNPHHYPLHAHRVCSHSYAIIARKPDNTGFPH